MNTMQLSCFVEVAAQLSFSKAAEALHVSQPTVSHQIKALEDELGCAMLVRSTRTVRLTDDGFAFLEYANDILDLAARAERRLKHKQRPSSLLLRIGVHDGLEAQLFFRFCPQAHECRGRGVRSGDSHGAHERVALDARERPRRRAAREPRSRGRARCGIGLPTAHGVPCRIVLAKGAQRIRATYP